MIKDTADLKKLGELIRGIPIAMLTTIDADGELRSRPMVTLRREVDSDLWFYTQAQGGKVEEIGQDARVNVAYAYPEKHRYVSVSGFAQVVFDDTKMQELWEAPLVGFFPGGLSDPNLALIKVRIDKAEYWETPAHAAATRSPAFTRPVLASRASNKTENKAEKEEHGRLVFE